MKKFLLSLGAITIFYFGGLFLLTTHTEPLHERPQAPKLPERVYVQKPKLKAVLKSLGASDSKIDLLYSTDPIPAVEEEWASYSDSTIKVLPDLTKAQIREMIGHEYLHHVWETKLTYQDREALQPELTALQDNLAIADRLNTSRYDGCGKLCKINETQAYACTIINKNALPELVGRYCKTYLPSY